MKKEEDRNLFDFLDEEINDAKKEIKVSNNKNRIKTKSGVTIEIENDHLDIITNDNMFEDLLRSDIYIKGVSVKLDSDDIENLKKIINQL